jgi:hypothetical protein
MEAIQGLLKVNYFYVFISVFIILIGIKAVVTIFEWVIDKLGLETKWMRLKREEHELLIQTSENLTALQKKHIDDSNRSDMKDEEISKDVQKLTAMFMEKEIDDLRWKILEACSALSN